MFSPLVKVIRDHPEWWTCMMMDGFGSHIMVADALEVFCSTKNHVVKEEGCTSHVYQSYNKEVMYNDKSISRQLLEIEQSQINDSVDQWELLAVLIVAILNTEKDTWTNSFKAVNLQPDLQVSFDCWIEKIKQHLVVGELTHFCKNNSLHYDAMPVCWEKLSVKD
eukprot:8117698-Ditylum_brightwellii.AAC.2